jgi:hypothetical protein
VHFLKHIALAGPLAAISSGAAIAIAINAKRKDRMVSPPCFAVQLQRGQYASATCGRQAGRARSLAQSNNLR